MLQTTTTPRRKLFEPDLDRWTPPEQLLELLTDKSLRTRDKVELVCGYYAWKHHGQHPYASEIKDILGISKTRVEQAMEQLVSHGRAVRIHGKFALRNGRYTNPVVSRLLAEIGEEAD